MRPPLTEAQHRTLLTLADGQWHRGTSRGLAGTVQNTPAAALVQMGLVERRGESRTANPKNSGYEYRLPDQYQGRPPLGGRALPSQYAVASWLQGFHHEMAKQDPGSAVAYMDEAARLVSFLLDEGWRPRSIVAALEHQVEVRGRRVTELNLRLLENPCELPEHQAVQVCVKCDMPDCSCPPPVTLCWNCEGVIPEGEGRVKDGFRVHDLCPPPAVNSGDVGTDDDTHAEARHD